MGSFSIISAIIGFLGAINILVGNDFDAEYLLASSSDPEILYELGYLYRYGDVCSPGNQSCSKIALALYQKARNIVSRTNASCNFDYPGMLNDIGVMLYEDGDYDSAKRAYYAAIRASPMLTPALANLAGLEGAGGNVERAIELYEAAITSAPTSAVLYYNFAVLQFKIGRKHQAKEMWEASIRLNPLLYQSWTNLATVACIEGLMNVSQTLYSKAVGLAMDQVGHEGTIPIIFQQRAGVIPTITASLDHALEVRQLYIRNLKWLLNSTDTNTLPLPLEAIGCTSLGYYAVYHGFEDLYVRQLLARLYAKLSSSALTYTAPFLLANIRKSSYTSETSEGFSSVTGYSSDEVLPFSHIPSSSNQQSTATPSRIKVGFLSAFMYKHSVGLLLQGVIKRLDRRLFQVHVITVEQPPAARDELTAEVEATVLKAEEEYLSAILGQKAHPSNESLTHHLYGMSSLHRIREHIAALRLDILVIGELGMDPTTYFLAFSRLARRSVVFWGHAVTSGIPHGTEAINPSSTVTDLPEKAGDTLQREMNIKRGGPDYFVSSVIFEGKAASVAQSARVSTDLSTTPVNYSTRHPYTATGATKPPASPAAFSNSGLSNNSSRRKLLSIKAKLGMLTSTSEDGTTLMHEISDRRRSVETKSEDHLLHEFLHEETNSASISDSAYSGNKNEEQQNREDLSAQLRRAVALSQLDYAERLILMDGMTTCFERPKNPLSHIELGLSGDPTKPLPSRNVRPDGKAAFGESTVEGTQRGVVEGSSLMLFPMKRDYLLYLNPELHVKLPPPTPPPPPEGGIVSVTERSEQDQLYMPPAQQQLGDQSRRDYCDHTTDGGPTLCDVRAEKPPQLSFHLYGIPQTLYKLNADFDRLIQGVLMADPMGYIVLPKGQDSVWTDSVMARLKQSLSTFPNKTEDDNAASFSSGVPHSPSSTTNFLDRVLFVRQMNEREYLTLCGVVDVILDPFPVGGGRSSLEIFSTGTPIVMLYPRTSILQLTYGMYETMGIGLRKECCVAFTKQEFIHKAVRIATNITLRTALREDILRSNYRLYGNDSVVREWEKMLRYIVSVPRPAPGNFSYTDVKEKAVEVFGEWYRRPALSLSSTNSSSSFPCSGQRGNKKENESEIEEAIKEEILRDIEYQWVTDELHAVSFSYLQPPILLRDINMDADTLIGPTHGNIGDGSKSSPINIFGSGMSSVDLTAVDSTPFAANDSRVPSTSQANKEQADEILFSGSFQDVDRRGVSRSLQINIHRGEDWRKRCAEEALAAGIDDKLKVLYVCVQVGRGVTRWNQKEIVSVPILINDAVAPLNASLSLREHDDVGQVVWQFVRTQMLTQETGGYLLSQLEAQHFPASLMGSPDSVEARMITAQNWLKWYQRFQQDSRCSTESSNHTRNNSNTFVGAANVVAISDMSDGSIDHVLKDEKVSQVEFQSNNDHPLATKVINDQPEITHEPLNGLDILSSNCGKTVKSFTAPRHSWHKSTEKYIDAVGNISQVVEGDNPLPSLAAGGKAITLGVTTSKRLAHFLSTMKALEEALGPLPGDLIEEVIIVDDGSSYSDRLTMMEKFPKYRYIFKLPPSQSNEHSGTTDNNTDDTAFPSLEGVRTSFLSAARGHAISMNILTYYVQTRFFLYLEDDWRVLKQPVLHASLAPAVDAFTVQRTARSADGSSTASHRSTSISPSDHPLAALIQAALEILQQHDKISNGRNTSYPVNFNDTLESVKSSTIREEHVGLKAEHSSRIQLRSMERVHQVLFNEQSRRACALAGADCDTGVIGRGGWARSLDVMLPVLGDSNRTASMNRVSIPYSLHEFGLSLFSAFSGYGDREHEFTYWPSLSLNPGLWDLWAIRAAISECRVAVNKPVDRDSMFDESDRLFEQRFSTTALAAGLRMAFLPTVIFQHTGEVSAYVLNGLERPWD